MHKTTSSAGRAAATTDGAAVRLTGLRKHFGDVRAVDGVDLAIAPGEVVALLGPNGAGKSTTVDLMLGLGTPDEGEALVFGRPPATAVADGTVGAMLQSGALLEDATVGEMVGMVASLHRSALPPDEALRRAGVADLAGRRGARLSGGQQQRVRFAIALVGDPDLLVLDEPTAAMDVASRREFWKSMHAFTDAGRTVLFATHYLDEAEEYADRVVFLRAGRIVADGPVARVRAMAGGRVLRAVVPGAGEAEIAGLPGVTEAELRGDRITVRSSDSDTTLRALLARFARVHDIEVAAAGLEGAFFSLTADDTESEALA